MSLCILYIQLQTLKCIKCILAEPLTVHCIGLWHRVKLNVRPNCTAERVVVLCIGLWYRVQLIGGPNCTADPVAVLCIGLWRRVQRMVA